MSNKLGIAATLAILGAGTLGVYVAPLAYAHTHELGMSSLIRGHDCDDEDDPDCWDNENAGHRSGGHGHGGGHHGHRTT